MKGHDHSLFARVVEMMTAAGYLNAAGNRTRRMVPLVPLEVALLGREGAAKLSLRDRVIAKAEAGR